MLLGDNVDFKLKDNILTLTINLTSPGTMSKSLKNRVVATTRGNKAIPGTPFHMGVNIYRPEV